MSNLNVLQPLSSDNTKIVEMSAEQHNLVVDYNQMLGSVKIDDNFHKLCLSAVMSRIDATADYTASRIEKINQNWLTYFSEKNAMGNIEGSQTISRYNGSEAFIACQDHLDDYVAIFANWDDQLDVVDKSKDAYRYISKRLELDDTDDDPKLAKLRAIYNSLTEEEKAELLNKHNTLSITDSDDVFYYQKKTAILAFMKNIVEHSDYHELAKIAFLNMIVTGHLVVKDTYTSDSKSQLVRKETGEFDIEFNNEAKVKFVPVDTRNLIFGPMTEWTIEKIPMLFSQILNVCLDEKGKPVENCRYDINQIRKLSEFIKKNGSSTLNDIPIGQFVSESLSNNYFDQTDFTDLYNIDGNITIYEAHNIPIKLPGSNKIYKTIITGVAVNNGLNTINNTPTSMVIIGVKKSSYIDGIAHHEMNMFDKKDDRAGFGVIDIIYNQYQMINNLNRQVIDLTKPGRSGTIITQSDTDLPISIQNIGDKEIINIKSNPRTTRSLNDIMSVWNTDYNMINTIQNMIPMIENKMKLASRKGSSGEKMSPNPSATEFSQITNELQKSVNLIAIGINNFLKEWIKRAYIYTIMNSFGQIKLNVQMERINETGELTTTDKSLDIDIPDLFIDDLKFTLKAYDNYQNTAVQKQQVMQVTNMLYGNGIIKNPQTGAPVILTDESGTSYNVSEYKLWRMILDKFDMDQVMIKTNTQQQQQPQLPEQAIPGAETIQGQAGPTVPGQEATPDLASIMQQAQLSGGVNV